MHQEKQGKKKPKNWSCASHRADLSEVPVSWLWPGSDLAIVAIWIVNQWKRDTIHLLSLSLSFCLFHSLSYFAFHTNKSFFLIMKWRYHAKCRTAINCSSSNNNNNINTHQKASKQNIRNKINQSQLENWKQTNKNLFPRNQTGEAKITGFLE